MILSIILSMASFLNKYEALQDVKAPEKIEKCLLFDSKDLMSIICSLPCFPVILVMKCGVKSNNISLLIFFFLLNTFLRENLLLSRGEIPFWSMSCIAVSWVCNY